LSMSGDLEDPSTAIPKGGLLAVAVGAVVYIALPFVLVNGASREALLNDPLVWTTIAAGGFWLVMPGMWGAVLSSAFGAILSAPRTLQALATDRLAPQPFAEVDEETGEPVLGLYFSAALALAAVGLGSLDAVATVVTMFFLTTYGALNVVALLESVIGDPSFRPRIRVPWWVSLFGAVGCFIAMAAINPAVSALAVGIETVIFLVLSRRSLEATWGDARNGLLLTGARAALMKLRNARLDARNWRPHIIVFTTDLKRTLPVVRLADDLGQHRGIVTLIRLMVGDEDLHVQAEEQAKQDAELLRDAGIWDVFSEVNIVSDIDHGAVTVAQANGIAGLQSNTVCVGYHPKDGQGPEELARRLVLARRMDKMHKCTLLHRPGVEAHRLPGERRTVLVWWAGRENNGDLMLLLAYLMTTSRGWRNSRIVLKSVVENEEQAAQRRSEFNRMLPDIRIEVVVDIVIRGENEETRDIIVEHSRQAQFVLLGLYIPEVGKELEYAERLHSLLKELPTALLVRNAGDFRGGLV
ncbi:MAG: amino acid permease, partial [Rhodobacterales bacterium]|nr:amino acid permease [Rhodobacterales bacterium]